MNGFASADVGLIIPTLNAGPAWKDCLEAVCRQTLQPHRKLVVDSSSDDDTPALAARAGFEVRRIARKDFNHGGTRQWAVEYLDDCKFIVFLTQDAILATAQSLASIISCFSDPQVAVAYGRQLPHRGAKPMEAHARLFNYGDTSLKKDLGAIERLGSKVSFCSNSFAAYRRSVLLELGGFRRDQISSEETEFVTRAIVAGHANAYCAQAAVYHSHDFTIQETFRRYFDIGVFHANTPLMMQAFGTHDSEGFRFVKSELRYLARRAPLQIPRAIAHSAAKLIGYKLGCKEKSFSDRAKRRLSMSPAFWASERPSGVPERSWTPSVPGARERSSLPLRASPDAMGVRREDMVRSRAQTDHDHAKVNTAMESSVRRVR